MLALSYQPENIIYVFGHLGCIWLYHVTEIFSNIFICSKIFLFDFTFTKNVDWETFISGLLIYHTHHLLQVNGTLAQLLGFVIR